MKKLLTVVLCFACSGWGNQSVSHKSIFWDSVRTGLEIAIPVEVVTVGALLWKKAPVKKIALWSFVTAVSAGLVGGLVQACIDVILMAKDSIGGVSVLDSIKAGEGGENSPSNPSNTPTKEDDNPSQGGENSLSAPSSPTTNDNPSQRGGVSLNKSNTSKKEDDNHFQESDVPFNDPKTATEGDENLPSESDGEKKNPIPEAPSDVLDDLYFSGVASSAATVIIQEGQEQQDCSWTDFAKNENRDEKFSEVVSVIIPNDITTILAWMFKKCWILPEIEIPANIATIEADAFTGCQGLRTITMPLTLYQSLTAAAKGADKISEYLGLEGDWEKSEENKNVTLTKKDEASIFNMSSSWNGC